MQAAISAVGDDGRVIVGSDPRVYCLAHSALNDVALSQLLDDIGVTSPMETWKSDAISECDVIPEIMMRLTERGRVPPVFSSQRRNKGILQEMKAVQQCSHPWYKCLSAAHWLYVITGVCRGTLLGMVGTDLLSIAEHPHTEPVGRNGNTQREARPCYVAPRAVMDDRSRFEHFRDDLRHGMVAESYRRAVGVLSTSSIELRQMIEAWATSAFSPEINEVAMLLLHDLQGRAPGTFNDYEFYRDTDGSTRIKTDTPSSLRR